MNRAIRYRWVIVLVALLMGAIFLLAQQAAPARRALVINGHIVPDAVVQINGHFYADIDALAESARATVKFLPDRVVLTMSEEGVQLPPPQAAVSLTKEGITKEFARAALGQLSSMREWKDAIIRMIKAGEPAGAKLQGYRDQAVESLRLASVSATTNSDQNALQLLRNEFAYMQQWDSSVTAANLAMSGEQAVNPNFPQNDAIVARISNCHSFLNSMIVSGVFADNSACH
jgi:hypothetical protein